MRKDWWVPLVGVLFVIVTLVAFGIQGEPPEADEGIAELREHYVEDDSKVMLGAALATVAALIFVFFVGYLRKVLRAAEGEGGMLSPLMLIGAAIFATGAAIDATISFALADQADEIPASSALALQSLWDNDFMPLALGITIFNLSTGLLIVLHGGLPKWLGAILILLALIGITPIGFAAFIGTAVWIVIVSILLTMRNRSARPEARSAGGPATP